MSIAKFSQRTAVLLCIVSATSPPDVVAQSVTVGLRSGVAYSRLNDNAWEYRRGYTVGAFATIEVHERVAFQPELLLTRKGADYPGEHVGLTYLQVPLLARVRFADWLPGLVRPTVYGGPGVAFLLSCRYAHDAVDQWTSAPPWAEIPCASRDPSPFQVGVPFRETRSIDVSAVGGVSVALSLSQRLKVILDARYDRGFLIVDPQERDARNESWSFTIAVGRGVGRERDR